MGSSRLPGKSLMEIGGKPIVRRVVDTCREVSERVIVLTSTNHVDNRLYEYLVSEGIYCFRGDEGDVLDRYYQAAKSLGQVNVIRVTADCPMLSQYYLSIVANLGSQGEYDYVAYLAVDGFDCEYINFKSLKKVWGEASGADREHVTSYIRNNQAMFNALILDDPVSKHYIRKQSIDTEHDLHRIRLKFERGIYRD